MARGVNPDNPSVMLRLTLDRKKRLMDLANRYGCDTISQFVGNIADGKVVIVTEDAAELLEYIRYSMRGK